MEFVIADADRKETGVLDKGAEIDLTLYQFSENNQKGKNDAKIRLLENDKSINHGTFLFVRGTEYGGRILENLRKTSSDETEWYMDTWRRMLGQKIITPPAGEAYRKAQGDANDEIRKIISGLFGDLFIVPSYKSGIEVKGQYDRYCTVLDGLNKILQQSGGRLKITAQHGESNGKFYVLVEAVRIADYSNDVEYSQDQNINLTIVDNRRGINHLVCLGTGELTERMVRHLYVQADGSIGSVQHYKGLEEREATFDYPNAENEEELLKAGTDRLKELMNYKKMELSVENMELELGDIIAGRDRESGMYLKKPIIEKVLRIKNGKETVSYKVKGDD